MAVRERQRQERASHGAATADAITPGKRTLIEGLGTHQSADVSPGKTTLTQQLPASASDTQASARSGTGSVSSRVPETVTDALANEPGAPLPLADHWSEYVGADVRHARIVTGPRAAAAAAAISARAFTVGERVFFSAGTDANTDGGALLAHELTHVAQQRDSDAPTSWYDVPFVQHDDAREHAARHEDARGGHLAGTGLAIARWGDGSSVTADQFLKTLSYFESTVERMFANLKVIERGPFGKHLVGSSFGRVFNDRLIDAPLKPKVRELIAPESLETIIDRSRPLDWEQPDKDQPPVKTDKGSNRVHDSPAAIELTNALIRHYFESIERMFPRIASVSRQKNPSYEVTPDKFVPWVNASESEVPVSHPMDVLVRKAMLDLTWSLDRGYRDAVASGSVAAVPQDVPVSSTPATLEFAPEGRLWHWVKASPETSTKEQVAVALFGDTKDPAMGAVHAHRLIAMPPHFGFRAPDVKYFNEESFSRLEALVTAADKNPDASLRPPDDIYDMAMLMPPPVPGEPVIDVDPVAELAGARGSKWAIERARQKAEASRAPVKPGDPPAEVHDEANIIDVQRSMLKNLASLDVLVPLFRLPTTALTAARRNFEQRLNEATSTCLKDPESAYAFANTQRAMLTKITIAIADAGSRLVQHGGSGAPDGVRAALVEVVDAFLGVLGAIEIPDLAEPRLARAEVLSRDLDIALQEATLHERLSELEGETRANYVKPEPGVDPFKHGQELDAYAMQLADARVGMRTSPAAAQASVNALKPKIETLTFDIGISEKLARLNMMWQLIENEEDIWQSGIDLAIGNRIQSQNRALYQRFKKEVYEPFKAAEAANDDAGKQAAREAYRVLLTGSEMKEHAESVQEFLKQVAKHKKWTKFVVSLAIAFVAFGLGQWQFGAVLAAEGTLFQAAVAGGLVATTTSVVLNKVIFDQNPTVVGVVTSFLFNAGTFFVVGKMALAARAAGVEAAVAEGTQAKALEAAAAEGGAAAGGAGTAGASRLAKAGNYAWGLTKEAVISEVMGLAQAQIEKLASEGRTLNWTEAEELFIQNLVSVVGMRVFQATTPSDLFLYKPPEQKIAADLAWLKAEQAALQARAKEVADAAAANPHGQPDKAAVIEVLDRWKVYLEREQQARQKLIEYAERHPNKFKASEVEALKASTTDPTLVRQMREAKALLAIEPDGANRFSCAAGALDTVIAQHKSVGNEITRVETDPVTGQRTITVKPADGSQPFEVTEKVPPKGKRTAAKVAVGSARHFEGWLDQRDRLSISVEGQKELRELYLRDPEAAMNLASEKYGYQPQSVAEPHLVVKPDAPGEAGRMPIEPVVMPSDRELGVRIGHGVAAIGNGRFLAAASELADMHASWAKQKDASPSKIVYDPETNTSHFEMVVDGKRVRIEASLAPRIDSFSGIPTGRNQVLGRPVSKAMGEEIMRGVAGGEPEMLKAAGLAGEVATPNATLEFGLGKLHDGRHVVILGEPNGVDWSALPGIKPAGHTHPLHPGNDLRPDLTGRQVATMTELLSPTNGASINRQLVFPSVEDFVTMAIGQIGGHKVWTGFVFDNGVIRKPNPGEALPRIEFTIGESKQTGMLGEKRVFESTIEGKAGSDTPITERKIWIVEDTPGGSGYLYMAEPAGVVRTPAPATTWRGAGGAKTKGTLTPQMEKLATAHGEKEVSWALDSVPDKDVEPLVTLPKPTLKMLLEVPAVDARDLIADVSQARVSQALSHGDTGPINAQQLVALRTQIGNKDVVIDMLDAAKARPAALGRLARVADGLDAASTRLPGSARAADTLVLDSNARSAVEDLARGAKKDGTAVTKFGDLDVNYQDAINAIRAERKLPTLQPADPAPMRVEDIVGAGTDIRAPQVSGAEAIVGEASAIAKGGGPSQVLPHMAGLVPNRSHADYSKVLAALQNRSVGGPGGAIDRMIVADTMFSAGPRKPTFISVDEAVFTRLAEFTDPPTTFNKGEDKVAVLKARYGTEFTIRIEGHEMRVRFR